MAFIDDALALQSRSLYPQGRAFAMPYPSSAGTPYVTAKNKYLFCIFLGFNLPINFIPT